MFNALFACLVLVALLFQSCDTIPGLEKRKTTIENKQIDKQIDTSEECDFSEFAPVRIKHFDSDAVINREQPEIPDDAVRRGLHGSVVIKALINSKGDVERACATSGESELRKPAERAALKWKFKPGYGLAFSRPTTKKNPKNYAEVVIVFDFK